MMLIEPSRHDIILNLCKNPRSILFRVDPKEIERLVENGDAILLEKCNLSKFSKTPGRYAGQIIAHERAPFDAVYIVACGIAVRYNTVLQEPNSPEAEINNNNTDSLIDRNYMIERTKLFQLFGAGECIGGCELVLQPIRKNNVWQTSVFQHEETALLKIKFEVISEGSSLINHETLDIIVKNLQLQGVLHWYELQRNVQAYHSHYGRNKPGEEYSDAEFLVCVALERFIRNRPISGIRTANLKLTQDEIAYYAGLTFSAGRNAIEKLRSKELPDKRILDYIGNGNYVVFVDRLKKRLGKLRELRSHVG